MTIYILSESILITETLDKYKISQDRCAILALILKSSIVHNRNLLCNEICCDVATVCLKMAETHISESWSEETITDFAKFMD